MPGRGWFQDPRESHMILWLEMSMWLLTSLLMTVLENLNGIIFDKIMMVRFLCRATIWKTRP